MPDWRIIVPAYYVLLFLTRYFGFLNLEDINNGRNEYVYSFSNFLFFNYFLKVLLYSFKFLVVSCIIYGGVFLKAKSNEDGLISFKDIFHLAVLAEFIFFIRDFIEIIYFTFISPANSWKDVAYFLPLSLYSLFETDSSSNYTYILQNLNLFEMVYMGILVYGLKQLKYQHTREALKIVLYSYGSLYLVWLFLVAYLV